MLQRPAIKSRRLMDRPFSLGSHTLPYPPAREGRLLQHSNIAKPMSQMGQERRIQAFIGTSAVSLNADICLRCNIRRKRPKATVSRCTA